MQLSILHSLGEIVQELHGRREVAIQVLGRWWIVNIPTRGLALGGCGSGHRSLTHSCSIVGQVRVVPSKWHIVLRIGQLLDRFGREKEEDRVLGIKTIRLLYVYRRPR